MFDFQGVRYLSGTDIASALDLSVRAVFDAIKELGLVPTRSPRDMRQEGYPPEDVEKIRQHIIARLTRGKE